MYSPPYIFFHGRNHYWDKGTDPALHKLSSLNDAPPDLLPSLGINVSEPATLVTWLNTNSAALITDITIFIDATDRSPQRWYLLLSKLQEEATNIQSLAVYWDAEGMHTGLGTSVAFVRRLAQLKVMRSVNIGGFYAKCWPEYLEENLGLKPVNTQSSPIWDQLRRNYQRGAERLNPWVDSEEENNSPTTFPF
jgi:hypothetical protein